jgi:magnesium-protoporphyrin O-methyltransferase
MNTTAYLRRRDQIQTYFDRTALDAWKRLTGTEKVSGVRATVRAGREEMRRAILSRFPSDVTGWRILDAGCGSGQLAVELARRGADVLGVDLSTQMIEHARKTLPRIDGSGSVTLESGDMLSTAFGAFDAVVAMDSLIHYPAGEAEAAVAGLARRTSRTIVFTLAPRTRLLAAMHMAGKLFPRGDRSPAIEPVATAKMIDHLLARADMNDWRARSAVRVARGFYISEAREILR